MATGKTKVEIKKIREISYNYRLLDKEEIASFNEDGLYIGFKPSFDGDWETNDFFVKLSIIYQYRRKGAKNIDLMSIEAECKYFIENLKSVYEVKGKSFKLPPTLMEALLGTTVSTVRGMIAVKTAGNYLSDYPLPLVDVSKMAESIKSKHAITTKKPLVKKIQATKKRIKPTTSPS